MKKHIEVVAAVIGYEDKYLCMQRNNNKHDYIAYKWEFPGGKIEENETHHQALMRELKEEMDYEIAVKDLLIKSTYEYPDFIVTINAYNCIAKNTDFKLLEHIDFKWLTIQELNSIDWAKADIPIVDHLIKNIK